MKRMVFERLERNRDFAKQMLKEEPQSEYLEGYRAALDWATYYVAKHEPIGDGGEVVAINDILSLAREMTKHVEGMRTTQGENPDGTFTEEQKINNAIWYAWNEAADWVRWFAEGSACNENVYEAWEPLSKVD